MGIAVGRWLDRHGPRGVLTAGSLLGVLAIVVIAGAQHLAWFFAGWVLAGAAMGAVLYPPAFAAGAVLIGGAIVAGMARGMVTLLLATAVTDRWGRRYYGHLTGLLAAPTTLSMALAPFAGAALAGGLGSYATAFVILGALAMTAAGLSAFTVPADYVAGPSERGTGRRGRPPNASNTRSGRP